MKQMIDTILGPLEARLLECRDSTVINDRERTRRTEYWFMGQLVRSDVQITLLQGQVLPGISGLVS